MIDCHTHLLPNLDDGSKSLEDSIRAFRQMAEGGIEAVICTSHYMPGLYQFKPEDYTSRFREVEQEVKHQEIPIQLYPGAEVYLVYGIAEDIAKNNLTLANSSYVLFETNLNGFPPDLQKNIFELLRKGYKPILAHAERYVSVMMKSHEAREMINRSVYIQVSAGSVVGGYGDKVKQTAWKLLNQGWVHLLGSDHHTKTDYLAFFEARNKIIEHIDVEMADFLTKDHPSAILNDEKIELDFVFVQKPSKHKHHPRLLKKIGL
jgi:protein-tyrosine phosphatase